MYLYFLYLSLILKNRELCLFLKKQIVQPKTLWVKIMFKKIVSRHNSVFITLKNPNY